MLTSPCDDSTRRYVHTQHTAQHSTAHSALHCCAHAVLACGMLFTLSSKCSAPYAPLRMLCCVVCRVWSSARCIPAPAIWRLWPSTLSAMSSCAPIARSCLGLGPPLREGSRIYSCSRRRLQPSDASSGESTQAHSLYLPVPCMTVCGCAVGVHERCMGVAY